ncbi:SDR family NAD(P)-dependent oxidoreductase [Ralstonia solanacearum]|nr:SDR family oxidoreductase [Ralstonia solanacearum]AMP69014.1 oxidoreductase [Ralstonia solanacearum]AMP74079.1 oxidoreductase [Ralstonia solanacearum]AYB59385.1 SDR family NAD(P)-dependent oxidoreductase [Ralstonia solanacearum]EUJ16275.1 oxidoreductase [Ralstonia solanacearum P673]MBB6586150.1 SDR family oxidoreductase [Ralstonia solanacearum]
MDLRLQNKLALVTGSTKGIGHAIAVALAAEGARVILNGRTDASVAEAVSRLLAEAPGAHVEAFAGDLSDPAQAEALAARFPRVDILVNNLGIFDPKPFEDIDDAEWLRFFNVNVMSGVRLSRAYLPGMKAQNWGRIVFISSESGVQIPAEMVHYGVTKTALLGLSRGLAELCAGTAVTVNAVLPGPTRSEGVETFTRKLSGGQRFEAFEKTFFETARPTSLIKRFATPQEVASLVAYVASPLSAATTGAALRVDGGVVKSAF